MEVRNAWSQENTETLIRLWSSKSAAEIAKLIHVTRSAVCGKISRLKQEGMIGIELSKKKILRPPPPPEKRMLQRKIIRKIIPATPPPLECKPCSLVDLDDRCCHWPLGGINDRVELFCGAAADAGPYCPAHADKAFDRRKRQ